MKLFTKTIDKKLFAQYPKGGGLEAQKVIAKVFNPYGRGRWYIINSDPDEPDYLWGIVELFEGEPEVGSFSREELENIKVGAFKLPLERDLYFDEMNAMEVYRGLQSGERYADGGNVGKVPFYAEKTPYGHYRLVGKIPYDLFDELGRSNLPEDQLEGSRSSISESEYDRLKPIANDVSVSQYDYYTNDAVFTASTLKDVQNWEKQHNSKIYVKYADGGYMENGGRLGDSGYLVQMAEEYAERENGKPVKKGEGMAKATKTEDGKYKYTQVTVFYKDGEKEVYEEEDFEDFFDIDEYAKGGTIKLLDQYDIDKGNYFYRRYEGAIGSFAWRSDNNKYNEGILFPLDDFDKDFYSHIQLKDGEALFRYKTEIMGDNLFPLIKVNFDRLVVHFLDDSTDEKNPKFYRRGTPLIYISLERYYYEVREFAKGGKLNYTSKRNIINVTINYEGKEYLVSGDDVITGAYKFAKGGLSDTHIYIPKRDVLKVTTKEGESIKSPLNGVWVKKEYFDKKEAKGSGKYEPSQATKVFAYKLTELAKDKELKASTKDSMILSLSMVDDFVNDLKYEIENNISGLAIETYANALKAVSKKNRLVMAKDLTIYGNANAINLFPESFIKTPLLTKKAISMKGNLLNNKPFLSELGKFTSDDALRPAMTAIRFDGKNVVATDANVLVHIHQDVSVEPQNLCVTKICETSKGEGQRYPDWKAIIARNLNDSKFSSATFDLDKLIVLTNWINNYNSVTINTMRQVSITTEKGEITFNSELLLKTLNMLKVIGMTKPIMYFESNNRAVYFGKEGQLSGDPMYDNFVLLMPLLSVNSETFSFDVRDNKYKIVLPEYKKAKGGKLSAKGQLNLFEN
jgi:hypothetical protein